MEKKEGTPVTPLAERLYVELVSQRAAAGADAAKLAEGAGSLAVLSIRLAAAFHAAEKALADSAAPKTTFKLDSANIAEWSK